MRMTSQEGCCGSPVTVIGTSSACPRSPSVTNLSVSRVRRSGQKGFHFRFLTNGVRKLVVPSGPHYFNSGRPLLRGLFSNDLGLHFTGNIRHSSALFKVGIRLLSLDLSTTFLCARLGV